MLQAHSRLAALLIVLRLHTAAVRSLEAALHTPSLASTDRRDYETRLREARAAAQRKPPGGSGQPQPDHYKLLGLERTCTVEDVSSWPQRLAGWSCVGVLLWSGTLPPSVYVSSVAGQDSPILGNRSCPGKDTSAGAYLYCRGNGGWLRYDEPADMYAAALSSD